MYRSTSIIQFLWNYDGFGNLVGCSVRQAREGPDGRHGRPGTLPAELPRSRPEDKSGLAWGLWDHLGGLATAFVIKSVSTPVEGLARPVQDH